MKSITRTFSALAFAGTLLASSAALASTPFNAATQAYRGELNGIPGYEVLRSGLRSGLISGEDILEAAGLESNARDANFVESALRSHIN